MSLTIEKYLPTKLQQDIWNNKYRMNEESLDGFFKRVSLCDNNDNTLSDNINSECIEVYLKSKKFVPAGRIMAGLGSDRKVTFSNCYVIPGPGDNIESIYDRLKDCARTYSYGGGVGIDISRLSPKGARINNASLTSTGAVSFMELYSQTTELIGASGRRK